MDEIGIFRGLLDKGKYRILFLAFCQIMLLNKNKLSTSSGIENSIPDFFIHCILKKDPFVLKD